MATTKKSLERKYFGTKCKDCGKPWADHDDGLYVEHRQRVGILVYPGPPLETLLGADFGPLGRLLDPPRVARPVEEWTDDELLATLADDSENGVVAPEAKRRKLKT